MKRAAVSEFKAKLSKYIRLVKSGESVEIQERGIPVALLSSPSSKQVSPITPARKDPTRFSKIVFSVHPKADFDVVEILKGDRSRR